MMHLAGGGGYDGSNLVMTNAPQLPKCIIFGSCPLIYRQGR
jgi:hypothetical protein